MWKKAIDKVSYKSKLVRVQRPINIRIAKAYSAVSNEALCIITELTPIAIKIEEFQFYQLTRGSKQNGALVDCDMELIYWHHPTECNSNIYGRKQIRTGGRRRRSHI